MLCNNTDIEPRGGAGEKRSKAVVKLELDLEKTDLVLSSASVCYVPARELHIQGENWIPQELH